MKKLLGSVAGLLALAACGKGVATKDQNVSAEAKTGQNKVATSGKVPTELADVPAEVLAAVKAAQPQLAIAEASAETRDGRNYYDVEGKLPDGTDLELDLMEEKGSWRVVETQRDIPFATVPAAVRTSFATVEKPYEPARIIESRQADGIVIYELFAAAAQGQEPRKVEVKYDGKNAELLTAEWAH